MAFDRRVEVAAKTFYFGTEAIAFAFWVVIFLATLSIALLMGGLAVYGDRADVQFFAGYSIAALALSIFSLQLLRINAVMTRFFYLRS